MLLDPEEAAVEGARHIENAVAVLPAPVAKGDQNLIFGHELAVEPGHAGIGWLRHGVYLAYQEAAPLRSRLCNCCSRFILHAAATEDILHCVVTFVAGVFIDHVSRVP